MERERLGQQALHEEARRGQLGLVEVLAFVAQRQFCRPGPQIGKGRQGEKPQIGRGGSADLIGIGGARAISVAVA